jgi:hypothetical protein
MNKTLAICNSSFFQLLLAQRKTKNNVNQISCAKQNYCSNCDHFFTASFDFLYNVVLTGAAFQRHERE